MGWLIHCLCIKNVSFGLVVRATRESTRGSSMLDPRGRAPVSTFEPDHPPPTKNWVAEMCERPECGVMRYCWSLIVLAATTATFLVLFLVFATRADSSESCVLTYAPNGAVTEAMMLKWTVHERWPLARPRFDKPRRVCVCGDSPHDPREIPETSPVVVWIAPGDLVSLYRQGELSSLPDGFVATHEGDYATNDHVKVCLEHRHLVQLWGTDATNTHCHRAKNTPPQRGVERFFLGDDGALFCASASEGSPPSPPPPSPPPPVEIPRCRDLVDMSNRNSYIMDFHDRSEHVCTIDANQFIVRTKPYCTNWGYPDADGNLPPPSCSTDEFLNYGIQMTEHKEIYCPGNECPFNDMHDGRRAILCKTLRVHNKDFTYAAFTPTGWKYPDGFTTAGDKCSFENNYANGINTYPNDYDGVE